MYTPVSTARATLPAKEPRLNAPFIHLIRAVLTPVARIARFGPLKILNGDALVENYRDFAEGRSRLIIGFRHPYGDDPQLTGYLFHQGLEKEARRLGKPLKGLKRGLSHVLFVYGMEVPLWSNPLVGWLLTAIGAVPVDHSHPDPEGMNRIRKAILEGDYPVALAPEGHVTYRSEASPEIENGTARFGFWCAEDLEKKGRTEKTVFLPLSFHYKYRKGALRKLEKLILRMEAECGLEEFKTDAESSTIGELKKGAARAQSDPLGGSAARTIYRRRLDRLAAAIHEILAASYGLPSDSNQKTVLDAALSACERILGTGSPKPEAGALERFYAMRAVAWDRLFRGDLGSINSLERSLADRLAGEAWYAMRHMETAEMLYHVSLSPAEEQETTGLLFERAVNLADLLGRARGGTLANRPNPALKYPVVVVGEPIVFTEFMGGYRESRKEAVKQATALIKSRYETCIQTYKLNEESE